MKPKDLDAKHFESLTVKAAALDFTLNNLIENTADYDIVLAMMVANRMFRISDQELRKRYEKTFIEAAKQLVEMGEEAGGFEPEGGLSDL